MKDLARMRLGVLREIKNLRKFLDSMERSVKSRNEDAIQKAYVFLVYMVQEMNYGLLAPDNIALDVAIAQELNGED